MNSFFLRRRRTLSFLTLEDRCVPAVTQFGGDSHHSGISAVATQAVETIHWQATVDTSGSGSFTHYGAPVVTDANTVIYPVRTGNTPPNFHVVARNGNDGTQLWDVPTDWLPKAGSFGWYPPYQPVLSTFNNRVYFAGEGGTIYYRTNADSASGTVSQIAFYGSLSSYTNNKSTYDNNVHVDTPLTVDNLGNVYFGFRVTGSNPANLVSGVARIDANGNAIWISAQAAAGGDTSIDQLARFSAPALSNNGSTLYFATRNVNSNSYARLVGVNSTTLASQYVSDVLMDPRNGGANTATLLTDSTASPMIAPDGRVFFGIFGNPSNNGSRGWMLQFSGDLATEYTPGGFGWDNTASVIPTSMVPQYTGTSPYLIFTKDNNYVSGDGDGSNKIAILDPNDTEVDTHSTAGGLLIMKRVLYKIGPTHDSDYPSIPTAMREWCINHAAVDPATSSVIVNSEDGKFYRWYLPTNTLTESVQLTNGYSQPYTMTIVGMDGTMYGMEDGILFAIGKMPGLSINDVTVTNQGTSAQFTVSLDFPRLTTITVSYSTANGSALAGTQYTTTSGTLMFTPGQKTQTITVPVNPNAVSGTSADFFVNLSSPGNASITDAQGHATIYGHPPRVASVVINGGSAQRSKVTSLQVPFDQPVSLPANPASAFQLVRQSDNATVSLNGSLTGSTVTLTFIGGPVDGPSLADGRYTLTVLAAQVSGGNFDGDGNGTAGDNYTLVGTSANGLYRLFGDSTGDGTVDGADFLAFRLAFLSNDASFDFDGSGTVDGNDFLQFRLRFLQVI